MHSCEQDPPSPNNPLHDTRRAFLRLTGGCLAHLALASACAPLRSRRQWVAPAHPTVVTAPFARLDIIGRDTWALISTPLGGDRTTFANGGIIAGRDGVIAVEGFYRPAGAEWLAQRARELTGKWPSHVVISHYHVDHAAGLHGYRTASGQSPTVRTTATTRERALSGAPVAPPASAELTRAYADVVVVPTDRAETIDLGNRRVRLEVLRGHTSSDLVIVDEDASMVWMGDLMWNGVFPNYVDAMPVALAESVATLSGSGARTFVPGHGAVADRGAVARYRELLALVERAARDAKQRGNTAAQAGAEFSIPASLGEWMAGKPAVERAMSAWFRSIS